MNDYRERCIEKTIKKNLDVFGAILLVGPKWCGKTTTAKLFCNSSIEFANPVDSRYYINMADVDIMLLLKGKKPRLFVEWQILPELWDAIRYDIDANDLQGAYILTGSNTVDRSKIHHSGAGRIVTLKMLPMSLLESGDSSGVVSITDLFDSQTEVYSESSHSIEDIARLIVRGGWPKMADVSYETSRTYTRGYCRTLLDHEISSVDGRRRDPIRMNQILRSLARNESTEASNSVILSDIASGGYQMHANTLEDYLDALRSLFLIDDLPAWCPSLRSKTVVRTSPVRHFIDPSIGAYFMGAKAEDLLNDPQTLGSYFESMVIRDLRVYASAIDGDVYHYRDKNGLEADAIIHLDDGRWAAFEIKLGKKDIDAGAENLLKLKNKVDSKTEGDPSFLAVITYNGMAYRRKDGVYVIPVGCLGP